MVFSAAPFFVSPDAVACLQAFQPKQLRLQAYLQPKQYGEAIQEFVLGFICVSPEYRRFAKPRRDIYTRSRKVRTRDGFETVREKLFECEVELPYDVILTATPEEIVRLMSKEVVLAVERLYKHQHKLNSFDIDALRQDIMYCLAFS